MKKINKLILGLSAIALFSQSCKKDLQLVNTNPGALNDINPEYLFTDASLNYTVRSRANLTNKYSSVLTYMQYIVPEAGSPDGLTGAYADPTKTSWPSISNDLYNEYYTGYGRDFRRIMDKINGISDPILKNGYKNLMAVAQVMDVYSAWKVADVYGAMPYTQAFNVNSFALPKYDYDWELYLAFDKQLKAAADVLKSNLPNQKDFKAQDFFYGISSGATQAQQMDKWLKLTNTLRIKIAQRFEKRDAANLTAVLTDIANNYGGKIISSNDESFTYSNLRDWNNNIDDIDAIQNSYVASYSFVEFLKSTKDPRLALMVRDNDWGTNYNGYNDVKANGIASSKKTLDSADVNMSRYQGRHAFPASASASYGWNGLTKTKTFAITSGSSTATRNLSYTSLIQTRLFVKNGGFKAGNGALHTDETVVDGSTIKMKTSLINYADVCFMMAEIAGKGGNGLGKSASDWYNAGVSASFADYKDRCVAGNVPNAANVTIGDFLTRFPYNGLASVYSQAWVNNLIQPEEAWAMWKRTGYPQFDNYRTGQTNKVGDGSGVAYLENLWTGSQNLLIPRRGILSIGAVPDNGANLDKAITDMTAKNPDFGANRIDSRGRTYWDMK